MVAHGARQTLLDFAVRKYALIAWKLVPRGGLGGVAMRSHSNWSSARTS
jgi:hypothetical protein